MAPSELLVVTWNVNGFARTHGVIKSHYQSLPAYLHRMGAAIFCVQETRVARNHLQNAREAAQNGAVVDGYRSFWSFNETKGKSGLNGVATWVREDVAAANGVRASSAVLSDPLDQEGRCLLVELGGLAVLNVYAPRVDATDETVAETVKEKKRRFFDLLLQKVRTLRDLGKSVILCGDLNLTWRSLDSAPSRCWVQISGGMVVGHPEFPINAVDGTWMRVSDVGKALHVAFDAPSAEMKAALPVLSESLRLSTALTVAGTTVSAGRSLLLVNNNRVTSPEQAEKELSKQPVSRLEFGLRDTDVTDGSEPAHFGHERPCVELLRTVVQPAGILVDTFARVHPEAVGRFTCWNQQLNLRFTNIGARLDYVLCDPNLAGALVKTPGEGLVGMKETSPAYGARAALDAATSFGRWHEAPRREYFSDEGGLNVQKDDMRLNETQFVKPHTGIIYTPPSYSDHVPASALFRELGAALEGALLVSEAETKRCTPWAYQPGLSAFFGRGAKRPLEPRPA